MPRQSSPLSIEYVLLGFLEKEPIHGYDLYKRLSSFESIGLVWRIKQSQLYAILERLEAEGLVTSIIIPVESHPDRKQYNITTAGRAAFHAWRSRPVQHVREIRMEFLAKLYFALENSSDSAKQLIESQKESCREWLKNMELRVKKLEKSQNYEHIVMEYRITHLQAILDWLENLQKEMIA
jgi:DNA-binding PadR family transcriptional regulator